MFLGDSVPLAGLLIVTFFLSPECVYLPIAICPVVLSAAKLCAVVVLFGQVSSRPL